jgi:hypothetical protein
MLGTFFLYYNISDLEDVKNYFSLKNLGGLIRKRKLINFYLY